MEKKEIKHYELKTIKEITEAVNEENLKGFLIDFEIWLRVGIKTRENKIIKFRNDVFEWNDDGDWGTLKQINIITTMKNKTKQQIIREFEEKLLNEWVNQIDLDDIIKAKNWLDVTLTSQLNSFKEMVERMPSNFSTVDDNDVHKKVALIKKDDLLSTLQSLEDK